MKRPTGRVTTALLARRSRALKRHLPEALAGDGVGVHQARVASRRLREAVPVLATGLKQTKAGKAERNIRRITRALGQVREMDVTLGLLDDLARQDRVPRLALEHVRAHVVQEHERRRAAMHKRLDKVSLGRLERRLAALSKALDEAETEPWRETLAARLVKRAKRLKQALDAAGQMYEPERLHKVRIAAKKLRYGMELAAEIGARAAAAPVRTLKRTQDTLGRLHDLQVLQSRVATVQAAPSETPLPDGGLDILSGMLEEECRHLHARYLASLPALLSVVDTTRTSVLPQLARPARRRRVLKMNLKPAAAAAQPAAEPPAETDLPLAAPERS